LVVLLQLGLDLVDVAVLLIELLLLGWSSFSREVKGLPLVVLSLVCHVTIK
jgi:hypothetical protein